MNRPIYQGYNYVFVRRESDNWQGSRSVQVVASRSYSYFRLLRGELRYLLAFFEIPELHNVHNCFLFGICHV